MMEVESGRVSKTTSAARLTLLHFIKPSSHLSTPIDGMLATSFDLNLTIRYIPPPNCCSSLFFIFVSHNRILTREATSNPLYPLLLIENQTCSLNSPYEFGGPEQI